MTRPARMRKHDRQTYGGAPAAEVRIDMTLAPFDRAVREAERRWGIDKLPEMVNPASAAKWGYAVGRLNEAIGSGDHDAVAQWVASCIRGLGIMEDEAKAAGNKPIPPTVWQAVAQDGTTYAVVQDVRDWQAAQDAMPGAIVVGINEVAAALHYHKNSMARLPEIRSAFQEAEVVEIRKKREHDFDDEIPF